MYLGNNSTRTELRQVGGEGVYAHADMQKNYLNVQVLIQFTSEGYQHSELHSRRLRNKGVDALPDLVGYRSTNSTQHQHLSSRRVPAPRPELALGEYVVPQAQGFRRVRDRSTDVSAFGILKVVTPLHMESCFFECHFVDTRSWKTYNFKSHGRSAPQRDKANFWCTETGPPGAGLSICSTLFKFLVTH